MFTTGSKILIGSSVLATVAAIVYGISQGEAIGIVGLISAAIALALLAGFNVWARDSNLSATDTTAIATSDAAIEPPGASIWPMVWSSAEPRCIAGEPASRIPNTRYSTPSAGSARNCSIDVAERCPTPKRSKGFVIA